MSAAMSTVTLLGLYPIVQQHINTTHLFCLNLNAINEHERSIRLIFFPLSQLYLNTCTLLCGYSTHSTACSSRGYCNSFSTSSSPPRRLYV